MATLFTTGTINQPDAGSVGQAMAERIRDDVVAHDAWELVEEFTPAAGTCRWYVFKCLASESGQDHDFFVVMGRTLGNGRLKFSICDTYNASGHEMSGFPVATVYYKTIDETGRYPDPWTLGTSNFEDGEPQTSPMSLDWVPSGTSTKWWLIVAEDTISASWNGASNGWVHLGVYEYLGQLANDLPFNMIGSASGRGYITCNPALANVYIGNTNQQCMKSVGGGGGQGSYNLIALGFSGPWKYNDKLQNNQRPVAEVGMAMDAQYNESGVAVYGFALGKQKRIRFSGYSMPDGLAYGDAFALNGTLWVPWHPLDGRIFDSGVASS